ncbi:monocarboxylate transporter 13 [Phymastichus coffea]|uniref:monocarboxylate transporter 13 n=1 Tax=Phymastichus coffea TaxID=108790 RepID=UPI00273CD323|nr:monocarboxylate transporter 13 [Phymastichus coffea]XP_058806583.1 monocarboxylate transporter 13 [Phymastichus coffea]XP_058806584.1 monocarboxylate transporter 13 [Phymastichus coffea]
MTHAAQASNGKPSRGTEQPAGEPPEPTPRPPDGGWGWVVVFASFMIHVITDGVTYSYGVFHVEFVNYFETTEQAASWVASFLVGVTYCSGPISSHFVNKFGCRAVTVAGTLLASACLLASVWVRSLGMLYLTAGVGTGLGFGLVYLPAIVSVTVYFERYRSLATGIAVCGSGLGTVLFAPFISYLIHYYGGYRHSMMLLSSIVLNCVVLGVLFRPLSGPAPRAERLSLQDLGAGGAASQASLGSEGGPRRVSCGGGAINRSDAFPRGSVHGTRKRSESLGASSEDSLRLRLSLRSLPSAAAAGPGTGSGPGAARRAPRFSLLRDPLFVVFCLSNFCTSIGFNVPYVYLIPQASTLDIDKKTASTLLSIIGVANTLGRVLLGYVSDKPWVDRLIVYNCCLTVCGAATMLCPLCPDFATLAAYAAVYGFAAGAYVSLTSVCLVDLVGLDRMTNAFGLVLLAQGVASFLGPPIAGALKDASGLYDPGFYVAGGMIAVSGLMLFVIPPIQRRKRRRAEQLSGLQAGAS